MTVSVAEEPIARAPDVSEAKLKEEGETTRAESFDQHVKDFYNGETDELYEFFRSRYPGADGPTLIKISTRAFKQLTETKIFWGHVVSPK